MKKIILFTNMTSIKKHWQNALFGKYLTVSIDNFDALISYLNTIHENVIIMLDELSVSDIDDALLQLEPYHNATILIFNSYRKVHSSRF